MSTLERYWRMGVGKLCDVSQVLRNLPGNELTLGGEVDNAASNLSELLDSPEHASMADALACAVLNRHFRKRGYLFRVDDDGMINFDIITDEKTRTMMADMAGL